MYAFSIGESLGYRERRKADNQESQREADTLSTLSHNLQTLRTTTIQQTQTIARHESRNAELDRQLALAGAQERAAKATLRSAESRTRALREEMGRLKVTVAQIRGQCANDIRRRDGEISRLKRHLEGRKGRDGNGGQVGVVVVTAGVGGKVQQQQQQQQQQRGGLGNSAAEAEMGVESPQYTLKQETTEFLTQLSQSLSDENDALIGLVRSSLTTLRGLQGLPTSVPETSGGAQGPTGTRVEYANVILTPPASFEILATGMDEVLEHLRGLLTNPSFVPIEEVEIREDEIVRLREAWEKMEARWREAVALMDGWRKRMTESGDSINLDDLRMGLDLGSGFDVPPNQEHEEMIAEDGENDGVDFGSAYEESSYDLVEADAGELTGAETIAQARSKGFLPRGGAPLNPGGNVLSQGSGNVRPVSPREIPFSSIPEGHTKDRGTENVPADEVALLDFSDLGAPPQPVSDQKKSRLPRHVRYSKPLMVRAHG